MPTLAQTLSTHREQLAVRGTPQPDYLIQKCIEHLMECMRIDSEHLTRPISATALLASAVGVTGGLPRLSCYRGSFKPFFLFKPFVRCTLGSSGRNKIKQNLSFAQNAASASCRKVRSPSPAPLHLQESLCFHTFFCNPRILAAESQPGLTRHGPRGGILPQVNNSDLDSESDAFWGIVVWGYC